LTAAPVRLEVWRLRDGKRLVLNVQSDLLRIETLIVAPLVAAGSFRPIEEINPTVEIAGVAYVIVMQQLSAIRRSDLHSRVADLSAEAGAVIKALDRLLTNS
jgi:CcdB protein